MDEHKQPSWDDRFASAAVAAYAGVPTILIGWMIAFFVGAQFDVWIRIQWAIFAWAILVASAFLVPFRIDAIFGRVWHWLLMAIAVFTGAPPE